MSKFKTVDVSGMGGDYEYACQLMIQAGIKFLNENGVPSSDEIKENTSDRVKGLEKVLVAASGNDCTGAMFFTSRGHAIWRVSKGDDWYFDQFKDEPGRIYEFIEKGQADG